MRAAGSWLRLVMCCLALLLAAACERKPPEPNVDFDFPAPQARTLVVFVHGILGHARTTFAAEGHPPWMQLLATDPQLQGPLNVLSLAYSSEPLQRASSIQEIATRLRSSLQVERRVFERFDKVVFVAHSMGGLVVRRLLLQLSRDDPQAYARVAGVFFLAVPAGGSDLAAGASWFSDNPQFGDMRPEDANAFLQADADDWATLLRRRPADRPYPRSYCAYENQPIGAWVVVPRSRSQMMCDETPNAFDRDHSSLVKPPNREDPVYRFVAARLSRLILDEDLPLSVSLQLLAATGQALPEGVPLRSGDAFALQVRTTRPAWIYIFGIDSSRRLQRYFPSQGGGRQSAPLQLMRLPQDASSVLVLDRIKGVEQFIAIASMHPEAGLEKLGDQARALGDTSVQSDLEFALTRRGAFFAKGGPVSPAPVRELMVDRMPGGERARATLTFLHN